MKIKYEDGPEIITMGIAGDFKRGEPKEVDDKIAEALLKKESIKFKKENPPSSPFNKGGKEGELKRRDK